MGRFFALIGAGIGVGIGVVLLLVGSDIGIWFVSIAGPLLALGVYDLLQTRHTLWRNYPVISHMRWLFEGIRPEIRQYLSRAGWRVSDGASVRVRLDALRRPRAGGYFDDGRQRGFCHTRHDPAGQLCGRDRVAVSDRSPWYRSVSQTDAGYSPAHGQGREGDRPVPDSDRGVIPDR